MCGYHTKTSKRNPGQKLSENHSPHPVVSEDVEQQLRDALTHLHDPDYAPSDAVCALLQCGLDSGALAVQSAAIRAIESLKPPPGAPLSAQARQAYELLHNRFVLKLTQEETAYRMHMSLSSIRRAQRTAVHTLARVLWERGHGLTPAPSTAAEYRDAPPLAETRRSAQAPDWQAQVQNELAALLAQAPDAVSDVAATIGGALDVAAALTAAHRVRVTVGAIQHNLIAAIHPTALRQILIAAIGRIARVAELRQVAEDGSGAAVAEITLFARLEDGSVRITLASKVGGADLHIEDDLLSHIPAPDGIAIDAQIDHGNLFLWITLPPVGRVSVLVVDDNLDMVRFYRRATEGTSYHIAQLAEGRALFETINANRPDVIVLDVMLPDVDGWELLMRLHEDPATRGIPVIVCSVVREEELALSLGAALYLAKPVRRRQLIEALDQAVRPPPGATPIAPGSSEAPC